ncbi:unnamed protein product [Adineta ricciae]|uniref:Uncharacterized protein n=1 Tax=Adineta ricciae TaxID=249248 RepID=A0A816A7X2_ADIRI|nr:unnamed protein product [Adineta ricciae]
MPLIRNVKPDQYDLQPNALATTGICTCIGVVIHLENGIFICHMDPSDFGLADTLTLMDAHLFFFKVFTTLMEKQSDAVIKSVYVLGGQSSNNYFRFKDQINDMQNYFRSSVVNQVQKDNDGNNVDEDVSDHPDHFISDITILFDQSCNPPTFVVCQYAGTEEDMDCDRNQSNFFAIYNIDISSNTMTVYIRRSNIWNSPFRTELVEKVIMNAGDDSFVYLSDYKTDLEVKIQTLLTQIEKSSILDDDE